jgi:translation initiation factor 1
MSGSPFDKLDGQDLPPGPPPKPVVPAAKAKPKLGKVILQYERAGRGGKEVTILKGLWIESQEMRMREALLKELKRALGTGGALEDREIVLQGDRRDTAKAWLLKEGFTTNL